MDPLLQVIIAFFVLINILALFAVFLDKERSKKEGLGRVSEGLLFFLAAFFGSLGVFCGMFAFRHKTRKWYFLIGIPFLLLQNLCTLYVLYLVMR